MSRFDHSTLAAITTTDTTTDLEMVHQEADQIAEQAMSRESDEETVRRMMQLLRAGADVRASKIRRLRAAVRERAYENQLKLSVAVDRMVRRSLEDQHESAA